MTKQTPDPTSDQLREQAQQAFINKDIEGTLDLLGQASKTDPNNFFVHLDLAKMYFQTGNVEKAQNLIEKLPDEAKDSPEGQFLLSLFKYTQIIAEIGDIETIKTNLAKDGNNSESLYGLSAYLMLNGQIEQAIQSLLKIFATNKNFKEGIAQKNLIEIFNLHQPQQPQLIATYRRKLQGLLF